MVQWFLLDRVDTEPTRTSVGCQDDLVFGPGTNEAEASLVFMEATVTRTQVTLNPSIV
jgi:hypothetical protein